MVRMLQPKVGTLDTRTAKPAAKVGDPFYSSTAYKEWRAIVLGRAGGKCQNCGAGGRRLYPDHIVERRDGGAPLDPANGRALCASCHTTKTAATRAARMAIKY